MLVEFGECLGARDAGQRAVETISPAVVGTGEALLVAYGALLGDQPRAAMTADIEEGAKPSVAGAGQQHRHAAEFQRQHAAGCREPILVADADRLRQEQALALGGEARGIAVDRGGERALLFHAADRTAPIELGQQAFEQILPMGLGHGRVSSE